MVGDGVVGVAGGGLAVVVRKEINRCQLWAESFVALKA